MTSDYFKKAKKATKKNQFARKKVSQQENDFFEENGKIFGKDLKHIMQKLRLPEHLAADLQAACARNAESDEVAEVLRSLRGLYEDGLHFVLPSFFELLIFLSAHNLKFGLLFRTFGNDANLVLQELG